MSHPVLDKKAAQAQVIYEDLIKQFGIETIPTTFVADERREAQFLKACYKDNPFPAPLNMTILKKRLPGVKLLFEDETVLQTPAIAAVLAACSSVATRIGGLRGDDVSGAETYCDVAFAGMQAIRLYMANHEGWEFKKSRILSGIRVNNAFNGSFFKYKARDGRDVSFHVYYQSQLDKLADALPVSKPGTGYNMLSMSKDKAELRKVVGQFDALDLEEKSFECGACGCMIRSREEWEATEVGQAVKAMPLIRLDKAGRAAKKLNLGKPTARGPLSGIKVLDLTHIIAGPACSRVLAEYGADVLLVRRGKFTEQEQAMLEFDGWAGKNSIQLDFNIPEQLEACKELIKEADVITYSYQNGTLDKFGLSEEEIRKLNPNVIYSNLMCFSDSVWKERPGWAPLAEDITGLSVRNGSLENPVNLNGVPLDYFPGMILALGTLLAIEKKITKGGGYKVTTSLTRGAQYLHECTDLCEQGLEGDFSSKVADRASTNQWDNVLVATPGCAVGNAYFPNRATWNTYYPANMDNLRFTDGNTGWQQT